jgi:hypothetical protein
MTSLVFSAQYESRKAMNVWALPYVKVAMALDQMGVKPGDTFATIGYTYPFYWGRLSRIRIVAEVPIQYTDAFRFATDSVRSEVCNRLATTGARYIISEIVPPGCEGDGWERVGDTRLYLRRLASQAKSN